MKLALAIVLAWLMIGVAGAAVPVILASSGFWTVAGNQEVQIDEAMNRALATELAARGIEIHYFSPIISCKRPDLDAQYYVEAHLEGTARTHVRSRSSDSPETETMSVARYSLAVWRFDEVGKSVILFNDTVIVPLPGDSPNAGTEVPHALAERIATVVEGAQ